MDISLREFVGAGLAGMAGLYAGGAFAAGYPTAPTAVVTGEDGYKLWLRYAPPGNAAVRSYGQAVRRILVEGSGATAKIIRDEMAAAASAMLGFCGPRRDIRCGGPRRGGRNFGVIALNRLAKLGCRSNGRPGRLRHPFDENCRPPRHCHCVRRRNWRALRRVSFPAADADGPSRSRIWTSWKSPRFSCAC